MDKEAKEMLMQYGIDIEDAMNRLSGREALIKRFLLKFPNDGCYHQLKKSICDKDYKASFEHSHNLKGISANLSMTELNQKTCALVEALRAEAYDTIENNFEQVAKAYDRVIEGIELWNDL